MLAAVAVLLVHSSERKQCIALALYTLLVHAAQHSVWQCLRCVTAHSCDKQQERW
jgi:hypothetical protein